MLSRLYPDALIFEGIGTVDSSRGFARLRSLLGERPLAGEPSALTVVVASTGLVIWGDAPVLSLKLGQVAAIGIHDDALDVTAVVSGTAVTFSLPLAAPDAALEGRLLAAIV